VSKSVLLDFIIGSISALYILARGKKARKKKEKKKEKETRREKKKG